MQRKAYTLPLIVFSQFACTSVWFAGNAIMPELTATFGLDENALYNLTSAVQLGFIVGTLAFALLTIADRYSPSKVFMVAAIAGALFNILPLMGDQSFLSLFVSRFATGVCLAGIYPVGMKIASDYHEKGLGLALGFLVGALVLGKSFPYFVQNIFVGLSWKFILLSTSSAAFCGGLIIFLGVPDGPFRKPSLKIDLRASLKIFRSRPFRGAAFGYFGHMWELYTFWTFVPVIITYYARETAFDLDTSLLSFLVIGIGALSCVAGGYLSKSWGSKKTAQIALIISGLCCLSSPLFLTTSIFWLFCLFLLIWGVAVIADSPQFSTLVAYHAPPDNKGTALTIVNCIGFAITILSIQLLNLASGLIPFPYLFILLSIGPASGLLFSRQIPDHALISR